MPIRVLEQHMAELIAAGEVVERPSSVVKELCENAIDADAQNISVEIEKGGVSLIRIADDGSGIPSEEIPLAFLRHATSKIGRIDDLEHIHTLGFRGEALASIASVAQVELLTMTTADEFASLYRIEGGQEKGLEVAGRPPGTTITVRNLFYNTPARMKFLKKDASEGSFVTEVVSRLALSHPEIAFRYVRDGKQIFATAGDDALLGAAYAVLGASFARDLVPVKNDVRQYSVQGLVTPPRASRASRSMQFFFINGRYVKNRIMMAALEQAYRGMVMHGKFPGCILFLQMPPELVDVNVHPAKTEVRFARESDVFDAVYAAVKSALLGTADKHTEMDFGSQPAMPKQDLGREGILQPEIGPSDSSASTVSSGAPVDFGGNSILSPDSSRIKAYNRMIDTLASDSVFAPYETATGKTAASISFQERDLDVPEQQIFQGSLKSEGSVSQSDRPVELQNSESYFEEKMVSLQYIGEIFKTYILAQSQDVLCIIDKHAAHERILYEKLAAGRLSPDVQQLLAPVVVTLSASEKNALLQSESSLREAGLEIEDFGGNGVMVRGVPSDVQPDNVEDLVVEIAERMSVNHKDSISEKTEWVLHSMACRAAVKAGDFTRPEELIALAEAIMQGSVPPFCPHGRPVVLEISKKELEKQFGRLG